MWSTTVWFAETKALLRPDYAHEEAVGLLSDRVQLLFSMQPQRPFVLTAALGADAFELLCFQRDPISIHSWRTGRLALEPHGAAGEILLHLFSSEPHDFGYSAPSVPEPFSIWVEGQAHRLSSFECLRVPSSSTSSSALATAFQSQLSDGQPIVVKLGDMRSITHEVGNSEALHLMYGALQYPLNPLRLQI